MAEYGSKSVDKLIEYAGPDNQLVSSDFSARSVQALKYIDIQELNGIFDIQRGKTKTGGRKVSRSAALTDKTETIYLEDALQEIAIDLFKNPVGS
ncbi:MAG: hypothetical protein LBU00_07475 [Treponema sp.]|nr:hypothetical protein [Treponema sp.]